jgi:hypothetical protein
MFTLCGPKCNLASKSKHCAVESAIDFIIKNIIHSQSQKNLLFTPSWVAPLTFHCTGRGICARNGAAIGHVREQIQMYAAVHTLQGWQVGADGRQFDEHTAHQSMLRMIPSPTQ